MPVEDLLTALQRQLGLGLTIVPDGVTDNAPAIQAALDDPGIPGVFLPETSGHAAIAIGSKITVPSGKFLRGAGIGLTTIKYLSTLSLGYNTNSMIDMPPDAVGVSISDFSVEGDYVGFNPALPISDNENLLARVHCLVMRGTQFHVENVAVKNVWGYAFWANGQSDATPCEGEFRHCFADNANVQFETNYCDNVLWDHCNGVSGDASTPGYYNLGNESMHSLVGTRQTTYRKCTFDGSTGGAITPNNNGSADMAVVFDDCRVVQKAASPAIAVSSSGTGRLDLKFIGGEFIAPPTAAYCAKFDKAASSALLVDIVGARFEGGTVAVFAANGARVIGSNSHAQGISAGSSTAFGVLASGGSTLLWDGSCAATGPAGSAARGGLAQVTPRTLQDPPPPGGTNIRLEVYLVSDNIVRDSSTNNAYVIFTLPAAIVDWSKANAIPSLMRKDHAPPYYTGAKSMVCSPFSSTKVMVQLEDGYLNGLTGGGYQVGLHYVERE